MPSMDINGGRIVYELLGEGDPLVLTPGGRFSMEYPGVRPLAEKLAEQYQVLLWDRPNTGKSDVKFTGASESQMHADDLAALLKALGLAPAVLVGGSAGSRLSLVTALRHPDVASKLVVWWMSGGVFGTMYLAMNYILPVIAAALVGGMPTVVDLPQWDDTLAANPSNRERLLAMDTQEFIDIQKRWLNAYIPMPDDAGARDQRGGARRPRAPDADIPRWKRGRVPSRVPVAGTASAHSGLPTRRPPLGRGRVESHQAPGGRGERELLRRVAAPRADDLGLSLQVGVTHHSPWAPEPFCACSPEGSVPVGPSKHHSERAGVRR